MVEILVHIAKMSAAMFLVTLVICTLGGWVLTLADRLEREDIGPGEKPLDLTGWRRRGSR